MWRSNTDRQFVVPWDVWLGTINKNVAEVSNVTYVLNVGEVSNVTLLICQSIM